MRDGAPLAEQPAEAQPRMPDHTPPGRASSERDPTAATHCSIGLTAGAAARSVEIRPRRKITGIRSLP